MPKPKVKRDISRENLEKHGIYYDDELYRTPYILPDYVDAVRETLLSFEDLVPAGGWQKTLQEEAKQYEHGSVAPQALHPPASSIVPLKSYELDRNERSPEWTAAFQNLRSCEKVAEMARKLEADSEEGWVLFWRSNTFTVVSEKAREQPGFHPVLDSWSLEGNCDWTEFFRFDRHHSELVPRTRPKPDLTYAFPITTSSFRSLEKYERDEYTRCFSLHSLGALSKRGLACTPTTGLRKWTNSHTSLSLGTKDLACFPWAVVEFKKQAQETQEASIERCYCQAANASAAALALRSQMHTGDLDDALSTLAPIISFTCVGPIVKIWLTYFLEPDHSGKRARRMVCIWSTSVLATWGVVSLRAITMNMHTWASRLLKPKVQVSVLQALRQFHPTPRIEQHTSKHTSEADVSLAGLFASPLPNGARVANSAVSTATSPHTWNIEESPCPPRRRDLVATALQGSAHSATPSVPRTIASDRSGTPTTSPAPLSCKASISLEPESVLSTETQSTPRFTFTTNARKPDRVVLTPKSIAPTLRTNTGDEADINEIIASLDSFHIYDTANEAPCKYAGPAIDSSEQFTGPSTVGVSFWSPPENPTLLDTDTINNDSSQTDLTNRYVPVLSACTPGTSIWSRLAKNMPVGVDAAFTPCKSPLDQPLISSNVERPTYPALATPFQLSKPLVVPGARFAPPMTPPQTISRQTEISTEPALIASTDVDESTSVTKQNTSSATLGNPRLSSRAFQSSSAAFKTIFESTQDPATPFAPSSDLFTPSSGLFESIPAAIERSHGPDSGTSSREPEMFGAATSTVDQHKTKTDVLEPGIYIFQPGLPENWDREELIDDSSPLSRPVSVQVPVGQIADSDVQDFPREEIVVSIDQASAACGHKSMEEFSYPLFAARRESTESTNFNASQTVHARDASRFGRCYGEEATQFQSRTSEAEDNDVCDSHSNRSEGKVQKPESCDQSKVYYDDTKDQDELYELSASDDDDPDGYGTESEVHPETDNESDNDEESENTDERGTESGSEQEDSEVETSSDTERSTCSSWRYSRNLPEEDRCWLRGLGSLDGYKLATVGHLRSLFMSQDPATQVGMIEEVVGNGPLKGDRYHINGQDLLEELLTDLNAHLPAGLRITRNLFEQGRATLQIRLALGCMNYRQVTHQDRWNCFKFALSIRSRRECGRILCTKVFDFTTEEWQWLEWSAKH